jgi:hypothetical protein
MMTQYIRQCFHCKKEFILKNIAYEKRGGGKYCSKQCSKYATKKYSFDEHFFDEINLENKAYWLGFCMADGSNTNNELKIEISAKDEDHLLKMKKDLNATQIISRRKRLDSEMVLLGLSSRYMCKKLSELGCIKNKSYTLQYSKQIPKFLVRHFIRGFFDGDGCIYIHKKTGNKTWSIYSVSKSFITEIKKIIELETKLKLHIYTQGTNGHRIVIYKKNDIKKMFQYLYDDATIFMDRKKNNFYSQI